MNISSEERLPVFLLDSIPDKQCALSVKGCFLLYFACLFTAFAVNRQAFFFFAAILYIFPALPASFFAAILYIFPALPARID